MKVTQPPLFVLGAQRSGTTLLIRLLAKHDSIVFLPHETHTFPLFWKPRNRFQFKDNNALADFIAHAWPKVNNSWSLPKNKNYLASYLESIRQRDNSFSSAGELLAHTFSFHAEMIGDTNKVFGEKTPSHIYYYKQILKQFPDAKFLIPVRDPRASALSEKIKLGNNDRISRSFKLLNFATRWETANQLAIGMAKSLGEKKVHIVQYESLIENPEPIIRKLCAFMQIEFIPEMLQMEVVNSSFKDELQKGRAFNPENLHRWKSKLSPQEISWIETYVSKSMTHYDYKKFDSAISSKPPLKNIMKLKAAKLMTSFAPANFHHLVRHEKYRSIS